MKPSTTVYVFAMTSQDGREYLQGNHDCSSGGSAAIGLKWVTCQGLVAHQLPTSTRCKCQCCTSRLHGFIDPRLTYRDTIRFNLCTIEEHMIKVVGCCCPFNVRQVHTHFSLSFLTRGVGHLEPKEEGLACPAKCSFFGIPCSPGRSRSCWGGIMQERGSPAAGNSVNQHASFGGKPTTTSISRFQTPTAVHPQRRKRPHMRPFIMQWPMHYMPGEPGHFRREVKSQLVKVGVSNRQS